MYRLTFYCVVNVILASTVVVPSWAKDKPLPNDTKKAQHGKKAQKSPSAGALPFVPPLKATLGRDMTATVDDKGITVKGADNAFELNIGGRIHFDASTASIRPQAAGPALAQGSEIRRAWLEPTLTLPNGINASFQYDFSKTTQPINNALIEYHLAESVAFLVGNFKEPFSLEQQNSTNSSLSIERPLLDAFAPARDFGGAVGAHGDRWTAVAGVFGGNINSDLANNGVAGTARVTYAPILREHEVLHFGVAGSYRSLDPNGTALSFSSLPEDDLAGTSLVDTGSLRRAADVGRVGFEALYQNGGGRIQAEYVVTSVGGRPGTTTPPDRTFQAGYLQAAYVLNGEGPAYRLAPAYGSEFAVLQGVKVPESQRVSNGGFGVFELGARVSAISLASGATQGGTELDGTLGLNWYPDHNIRLMADYVRAYATPAAASVLLNARVNSNLFVGRAQLYW